jgi:gamma-glutamyltranspeptidase
MSQRLLAASGRRWAVATPHTAATNAAQEIFAEGGNAIDAAVTAAATLAVVYPHMCGIGGDLFALVQEPDGQAIAINSSGAAPAGIDVEAVRRQHASMPEYGPIPITVPGAVAGWASVLAEGGTIPWRRALEPAIGHASEGVAVARSLAASLRSHEGVLRSDPGMHAVFGSNGGFLGEGARLRQPGIAETLRAIAAEGPGSLYGGEVGRRYVTGLRRAESPMTEDDLAAHRAETVPPLIGRYRDLDVRVVPPNSQGFVLLEMLAGIERMELDPDPLGPDAGLLALVFRAASADRDRHNADPHVERVPVVTLLDDGHIAGLIDEARGGFDMVPARTGQLDHAASAGDEEDSFVRGDTIALVTADGDGRAVSLIQSLFHGFGAGILEPETGIVAQNRGACFSLDPHSKNVLAPRKRPAHTLMPVLVHREDGLAAVCGTMGGHAQPQINAMSILRMFDLGLPPDRALREPRWLAGGMDPVGRRRPVVAEADVPATAFEALRSEGFEINSVPEESDEVGHAHAIRVLEDGTLVAGTDPRADGSAAAG